MTSIVATIPSLALIAYAAYQYQHDVNWWTYVPAIGLAGMVCLLPMPSSSSWRLITSIVVVGGTLLMLFFFWTFHSLEGTVGYDLKEAKNLPLVAIGVALTTSTRLFLATSHSFVHHLRSLILFMCLILSLFVTAYSIKYCFV